MDRNEQEQARLARLVQTLADAPEATVRWVSAEGIVLERAPGQPWWLAVGGDEDGRAMLARLLARWAPPSAEVLLVGGRPEPVGCPSVHISERGVATILGANELGRWVLQQAARVPAQAGPSPVFGTRPGRIRTWLDGHELFFTPLIIALCVFMYGIEVLADVDGHGERLLMLGALPGHAGLYMPWLMLSYAWLHGSVAHLFMNMLALWFTGTFLEPLLGRGRFLVLYVLSAIGGGLAIALFSDGAAVGASGAIWGLMTAMVMIAWRGYGILPGSVRRAILPTLLRNLAINAGLSLLPGISFAGHFGGGLAGALVVATGLVTAGLVPRSGVRPGLPRWLAGVAIGCALLVVIAQVLAVVVGSALVYGLQALGIQLPP